MKNWRCASNSPRCSKALTLMAHCSLAEKNHQRPKKQLFSKFSSLLHIYLSRRNFFVLIKISYLQSFREIMGGQRIRKFSVKMTPQAKKMTFFRIFFFCCTSSRRDETFLLLPKFHIFSRSEKSWGDKEKALHRTTNYIDDENSPPGFFQNPRANNYHLSFQTERVF